ncbi:MAG: transcription elongation factor GreA [Peptostreptococcaceae bacterium]|nr:transcription elongation factor GreA [Peptostreptococcaceae bacterium]
MDNKKLLVTQSEYDSMQAELDHLENEKREEIKESLRVARDFGDLSENAEYTAAKEAQAQNEQAIGELRQKLSIAQVVDSSSDDAIDKDTVSLDAKVKVEFKDPSMKKPIIEEYHIVGTTGSDPINNKISNESPIGAALLGRKIGEEVSVQIPMGMATLKIIEVSR